MKIQNYYDEFFNNNYNRDLRTFTKQSDVRHAPKIEISNERHAKHKRNFIKSKINSKMARYTRFYCGHTYFEDILDYQLANDNARTINHFFFDFDKEFAKNSKFKNITNKQSDAMDKLHGNELFDKLREYQEQIQDMILFENILNQSWQEAKIVNDYFQQQGLKTYTCLSSSKGVHLRAFFKPIQLNNYNDIIHDLHKNLVNQFDLKTLDPKVSGKDSNPLKSVERLPYSFNEKSGLRVTPFDFEHDSLDDVIDKAFKLSEQKIVNVEQFRLADYINTDFHNGILKLDKQIDVVKSKEKKAREQLLKEKIKNGTVSGTYGGANPLFKDLRILVRFVCGDDNLVSEHDRYDKYHCHFHGDKNPSCIVGMKNYTCLSSNCKITKLNYFEFLRLWFGLESDDEVKEKMVELQQLYDEKFGDVADNGGENVEQEIDA